MSWDTLSTRARNVLHLNGYDTVDDVRRAGQHEIMRIPNCGKVTVDEIGKAIGGWPDDQQKKRTTGLFAWSQRAIRAEAVLDRLLTAFEEAWTCEVGSYTEFGDIAEVKRARELLEDTRTPKRGGRPVIPGITDRNLLKVTEEMKQKLDAAARASGRTQSQEAEMRLERSFHNEKLVAQLTEAISGRHPFQRCERCGATWSGPKADEYPCPRCDAHLWPQKNIMGNPPPRPLPSVPLKKGT